MNMKQVVEAPSSDSSKVIRFGLILIFVVFVIFGGWMAYAPLAASSVAPGIVSADLDKKTIQHLEGGKIAKIYVKNGDHVKQGDILIKLRDVQVQAQLDIYKAQLQDALAIYARLQAHIKGSKALNFSPEITDNNVKEDQRNIFITINNSLENEHIIMQKRITQIRSQIEGTNSLLSSKQNRLASLEEEVAEWSELYKNKLVDKQRIRELEREQNNIMGSIASQTSEIAKLEEKINEIESQQALKEKEFNKENLQQFVKVKASLYDLKSKIIASEDTLERTKIVAPIDGTVVAFNMHTVGGIINRGEPIMEIIPSDSQLLIIARVSTTDIDKVKVGLIADITLPAFNMRQIHIIQGRVIYVSADIYTDKQTAQQYYEAKIELTKEGYKTLQENEFVLVPGMPAQAMIQLGNRTALSYLVKPFTDMLLKGFNEE